MGETLDIGVLAAGYIVMRVAIIAQWLRVARQDPEDRRAALPDCMPPPTSPAVRQPSGYPARWSRSPYRFSYRLLPTLQILAYLVHAFDPLQLLLVTGSVTALAVAVAVAATGAGLGVSLLLVMLAPAVIVVGYETIGHRHLAEVMQRQRVWRRSSS